MTTDISTLPERSHRVELVCNSGSFMDAELLIDGKPCPDVWRVEFVIEAGQQTKAVIHIDFAAIDIDLPMRRVTYEATEE